MRHTAAVPAERLAAGFGRDGDVAGFEELVRRYSAFIYSVCYRTTGNRHDAEDAAQIAFLQLAIALKSGKIIERPAAWLEQVAHRQALRLIRTNSRSRRRDRVASKTELHLTNHADVMDQSAVAGVVRDQIDSLPERYRLPLVLHYFGGMSLETIANELKSNTRTIGTRLHRGRKLLGERLQQQGLNLEPAALVSMLAIAVPAIVAETIANNIAAPLAAPNGLAAAIIGTVQMSISAGMRRPLAVAVALALSTGPAIGVAMSNGVRLPKVSLPDALRWMSRLLQSDRSPRVDSLLLPPAGAPRGDDWQAVERPMWSLPTAPTAMFEAPPTIFSAPVATRVAAVAPKITTALPPTVGLEATASNFVSASSMRAPLPAPVERAPEARLSQSLRPPERHDIASTRQPAEARGNDLQIAPAPRDVDRYVQTGGRVEARNVTIGQRGRGEYALHGGQLSAESLIIRATSEAGGKLIGYGKVNVSKEFIQNGQVIADGLGQQRTLDLTNTPPVKNTIENPPEGTAGWYAVNGGRIDLPAAHIDKLNPTVTFGESSDDKTLDLVNSVRLTAIGVSRASDVSISILSTSADDIEFVKLPREYSVVGLYAIDGGTLQADTVNLSVRYDHAIVESSFAAEGRLTFLVYRQAWTTTAFNLVNVDTRNNVISTNFRDGISYSFFAVGSVFTPTGILSAPVVKPSVPEPTTVGALMLLASTHFLRRRRAKSAVYAKNG